jgi:hypothetical protein
MRAAHFPVGSLRRQTQLAATRERGCRVNTDAPLLDPTPMTMERFNELLNGPLNHPMGIFAILRLSQALWFVLNCTGERGAAALEAHCRAREEKDNASDDGR